MPIGNLGTPYSGSLNGNGFTINNLYENMSTSASGGLFGATSSTAVIQNVGLTNASLSIVTAANDNALLVADNGGEIINSYVTNGTITNSGLGGTGSGSLGFVSGY